MSNYLYGVFDCMFLSCYVRVSEWIHTCRPATLFKELLARCKREIWSLSDCNWTGTHNHLVRKRTLKHLAKLAKWLCIWVQLQSLKLQISRLLRAKSSLTFRQLYSCEFTLKRVRDMTRTCSQISRDNEIFNSSILALIVSQNVTSILFIYVSLIYWCQLFSRVTFSKNTYLR